MVEEGKTGFPDCPLCLAQETSHYGADARRPYYRCAACSLVFVPPTHHGTPEEALERYACHHNSLDNAGYRAYLSRVARELTRIPLVDPAILDFGSGREAVLTTLLTSRGFTCHPFDPLYHIGADALQRQWDLVVACEVAEHFTHPRASFELIDHLCTNDGYIFIKTEFVPASQDAFVRWWYIQDFTHLAFFSERTFATVAGILRRSIFFSNGGNVVIFGPKDGC